MSFKENLSKLAKTVTDNANTVAKTVGDGANIVAKKSSELLELSKLTVSVKTHESKINTIYEEIGKIVYAKFINNVCIDEELTIKCTNIIEIEKEIHEMNKKMLSFKNKKVCTKCGEVAEKEAIACIKCGNEHTWETIDAATKNIEHKFKTYGDSIIKDEDKF